jgi:ADP-dependent phosphofructokinase/glucokinase
VRRVVEDVRRGGVDGDRTRVGGGVGILANGVSSLSADKVS